MKIAVMGSGGVGGFFGGRLAHAGCDVHFVARGVHLAALREQGLTIENSEQGDIKVTFFPKLGLDSGQMLLRQRNSAREFASVNNARLYIAWLPLLKKQ